MGNLPTTPVLVFQLVEGARSPIEWQPVIASPQLTNYNGRATHSCFALIEAHQCGVLMVDGWSWWLQLPLLFLLKPQVFNLGWIQKQPVIQPSIINTPHWWAPCNQDETAVCSCSTLVGWLGGADDWLPVNRVSCPLLNETPTGVVGRFGAISSDYSWIYCLCSGLLQAIFPLSPR